MSDHQKNKDAFIKTLGITTGLVRQVEQSLADQNSEQVLDCVKGLHAADVADLIEQLNHNNRIKFVDIIRSHLDPEMLAELDESIRESIIEHLSPQEIAAVLTDVETDEAVYILEDLDDNQQQQILSELPIEDRLSIEKALSYPEDSAGRLMQLGLVVSPPDWTIGQVIESFESHEDLPERFYDVYIVDPGQKPIGMVALDSMLRHRRQTRMSTIMAEIPVVFPISMDQEQVAYLFEQYGLFSAPVVNDEGRLVGTIIINDIVDIIREETEEDLLSLGGVSDYTVNASIADTSLQRLRWLIVTFINTLIASTVISHFEPVLSHTIALAFLMPIVAAMGGNSGMQVVTVTVRALANRDLLPGQFFKTLRREVMVALINGVILAFILAAIATFWFGNILIGGILGVALVFNILWSAVAGTAFPILLTRMGLDPAISSGPLLTTTTDVFGFAFFLGLATLFLI